MKQRRFQIKARLIPLVMAALLVWVAADAEALEIGSAPPDFEVQQLGGGTVRLSDYRGRPIVLKLATTWCPSCKAQVKELALARQALEESHAAVLEIYVDEPVADVRSDLEAKPHAYPSVIAIDDGRIARKYSLLGIPRVLLIDREFRVRRDRGLIEAADLAEQLAAMSGKE